MSIENKVEQVDGDHYQAGSGGVQHWDYCVGANVGYLEGCATKYLCRWRKKNGLTDLKKARHFVKKRIDSVQQGTGAVKGVNIKDGMFNRFISDNGIPAKERGLINVIMHWKRLDQLIETYYGLNSMIHEIELEKARGIEDKEGEPTSAYVNQDA